MYDVGLDLPDADLDLALLVLDSIGRLRILHRELMNQNIGQ